MPAKHSAIATLGPTVQAPNPVSLLLRSPRQCQAGRRAIKVAAATMAVCWISAAAPQAFAQVTCSQFGIQTTCSNGQTFTGVGNMTFDNYGNNWNRVGNSTFGPGGPYQTFGNQTISPGGTYSTYGNTTYGPGGHSCMRVGIQTICN
jgi:hypothetical protein